MSNGCRKNNIFFIITIYRYVIILLWFSIIIYLNFELSKYQFYVTLLYIMIVWSLYSSILNRHKYVILLHL